MSVAISLRHSIGDLDLTVDCDLPGGLSAIFGPSGAGKTSILRAVAGLLTPDQGRVQVGDRVLFDSATRVAVPAAARRVGYVFQEPRLFPHLSVDGNLRYGQARAKGRALPLGFDDLVALLGLEGLLNRRPATLSGGEGQRVALGRALLSAPDILLMDEPLSALDTRRKSELLPYFERLRDQVGLPILYVSHDLSEVARLADTVVLLEQGQMRAVGPVAEVVAGGDTAHAISRDVAGGILRVTVAGFDEADQLSEMRIGDQALWLPGRIGAVGDDARLRIDARDVILMRDRPEGISALNVLPVTVLDIQAGPGSGALVRLDHQGQVIVARVTQRSVRVLGLSLGLSLFAVLKSMAVTQDQIGR